MTRPVMKRGAWIRRCVWRMLSLLPGTALALILLVWAISVRYQLAFGNGPGRSDLAIVLYRREPRYAQSARWSLANVSISRSIVAEQGELSYVRYWPDAPPPTGSRTNNNWFGIRTLVGTYSYRPPEDNNILRTGAMSGWATPLWCPALVLGLIVGAQCGLALRQRRARHLVGHCPACGYDLRATPDRCPECGRVAQLDAAAIRQ